MNRKWFGALAAVLSLMVLAACGKAEYEPQAINEETDRCAICNMAIADGPFATQIITTDGRVFKFDDIGCMHEWMAENGTDSIGAALVRDYHSKYWLKMEEAVYVYDRSFQTPMAYGVLSFAKEEDARAFIDEQGKGTLMKADELADHSWERNREMMDMDGHSHSHGAEGSEGMHNPGGMSHGK
jgi:copper chaperone NosL